MENKEQIDVLNQFSRTELLVGLSVLPEYRGQGIARALMEEYSRRDRPFLPEDSRYIFRLLRSGAFFCSWRGRRHLLP